MAEPTSSTTTNSDHSSLDDNRVTFDQLPQLLNMVIKATAPEPSSDGNSYVHTYKSLNIIEVNNGR